jgi:hypothetical protein
MKYGTDDAGTDDVRREIVRTLEIGSDLMVKLGESEEYCEMVNELDQGTSEAHPESKVVAEYLVKLLTVLRDMTNTVRGNRKCRT